VPASNAKFWTSGPAILLDRSIWQLASAHGGRTTLYARAQGVCWIDDRNQPRQQKHGEHEFFHLTPFECGVIFYAFDG
jgi:hypothetical protein